MLDITEILARLKNGDPKASEDLFDAVYADLRRIARKYLATENPDHILQPTALVNESYLRLFACIERSEWNSRRHFFCAAAEAMRHILVDYARASSRLKRGGDMNRVPLPEDVSTTGIEPENIIAVHEALDRLEALDVDKAELVKLRYFCGMTLEEAAESLGISRATASRHWAFAKAWLFSEISNGG